MSMARLQFSPRMQLDLQEQMWRAWCSGKTSYEVAALMGVDQITVLNRVHEAGGIRPRRRQTSARLSYEDRVHIEVGLKQERSLRAIAEDLRRSPSTISREVKKHRNRAGQYVAKRAHAIAFEAARRPQERKIDANPRLKSLVLEWLAKKYSPEEIAGRLGREFPDEPAMNVHHETVYRWIYLQPRGELKKELTAALRKGKAFRRAAKPAPAGTGHLRGMVSIHDRPPVDHPDGTRIPGHWEGDLIIGKNSGSAIGTIVERATGYLMLLHLPDGRGVEQVTAALTQRLLELPETLRRSLTWDQGKELAHHAKISIDAGIDIYFADPHTPWHRPSNENTNGLLRQYFPKGTDLTAHSAEQLLFIEQEMNDRPRKRLDYARPQELMTQLLLEV